MIYSILHNFYMLKQMDIAGEKKTPFDVHVRGGGIGLTVPQGVVAGFGTIAILGVTFYMIHSKTRFK